jgi:hypothetical protein
MALSVLCGSFAAGASAATLPEFSELKDGFTSTLGSSFLEVNKERFTCTSGVSGGQTLLSTRMELAITYKGCENKTLGACTSPGASTGEIITSPLFGDLGYLKAKSTETGVDLSPQSAGVSWMEFTCAAINVVVGPAGGLDTVIGKITPVNTLTTKFVLEFNCIPGEKQEYNKVLNKAGTTEKEGELNAKIGSKPAMQACLTSTANLTFAKSLKIGA